MMKVYSVEEGSLYCICFFYYLGMQKGKGGGGGI